MSDNEYPEGAFRFITTLHMGYQSFEDSAICASVIVRNIEAGLKVWRSSAGLREKDQVTTKRVESLRAPCLDASSTLATSTFDGVKHPSKLR